MKIPFLRHTCVRITTYIILFCCLPTLLAATPWDATRDSVDTEGAVELDAITARKELQESLPKSLDTDLGLLMETWRTGYATQQRFEVPCGSYKAENIRSLSDSVLISRLKALPTVIPIPYNAMVKEGIATYITDRPRLIRVILALGDYYFPIMEEIFDRHRLPVELVYLTVVESALNPFAVSPAGASGLWQLMLPTGRSLGLTVNSLVDERFDVYKSSEAAALYLKQLYGLFDNWLLAIAAYNCGPGNVTNAIRRSGGKTTFWDVYPYLLYRSLLRLLLSQRTQHLSSSAVDASSDRHASRADTAHLCPDLAKHRHTHRTDPHAQPAIQERCHPRRWIDTLHHTTTTEGHHTTGRCAHLSSSRSQGGALQADSRSTTRDQESADPHAKEQGHAGWSQNIQSATWRYTIQDCQATRGLRLCHQASQRPQRA